MDAAAPAETGSRAFWRRLDTAGHDAASLSQTQKGWTVEGVALFLQDGEGACLRYRVDTDDRWQTQTAIVEGWLGPTPIQASLVATPDRQWFLNGAIQSLVAGCDDIDLSFTPATNIIPIRRLGLPVGSSHRVAAAWLTIPGVTLEPLHQVYSRVSESRYDYEAFGGTFRATLDVSDAGWVINYPELWRSAVPPVRP